MESLISKYKIELFTIRDCFATSANYIEFIKFLVKKTFLSLYSKNILFFILCFFFIFIYNYYDQIRKFIELNRFKFVIETDTKEVFILLTTTKDKIDNINYNNLNIIYGKILRNILVKMFVNQI